MSADEDAASCERALAELKDLEKQYNRKRTDEERAAVHAKMKAVWRANVLEQFNRSRSSFPSELKSQIKSWQAKLKSMSPKTDKRDALVEGGEGREPQETEQDYIRAGQEILAMNQMHLQDAKSNLEQARMIGENSLEMLEQQDEALKRTADSLDEMESTLKVSEKVLKSMARKMMTDKYLWVMIGLTALAIIGAIVAAAV